MPHARIVQSLLWLSALLLAGWVLSGLPLATIRDTLAGLAPRQWGFWIAVNVLIVAIQALRWLPLTRALGIAIGPGQLLMVRQAGQSVSFLTPGPQFGGEPLQVYWLWKRFGGRGHKALLAVALDRFLELWLNFAVLLIGIVILLASPAVDYADWPSIAALLLMVILTLTALAWFLMTHRDKVAARIRRLGVRWQHNPRIAGLHAHWENLSGELQRLARRHKPALLLSFLLAIAGWAGILAELTLLLAILGIPASPGEFVLLLVAMRLAILLPLPGGVGTLEAAVLWTFTVSGLPAAGAVALIALMRLRDGVVVCLGLAFLRMLQRRPVPAAGPS